jgi:flagellar biosynthesis chaperone FliJ
LKSQIKEKEALIEQLQETSANQQKEIEIWKINYEKLEHNLFKMQEKIPRAEEINDRIKKIESQY